MVLATALFEMPAFKNLVCSGFVLAEDERKMSKKLKNNPSPMKVIGDYGAVSFIKCLMASLSCHCCALRLFQF